MNPSGIEMQRTEFAKQNGMMEMYNGQMIPNKAQDPDEEKLFNNELRTAPQSSPNNYIYTWNKKLKKYVCFQEPHMYQNHKIENDTHQYFLKRLHQLPIINPSARTRILSMILGVVGFFLANGVLVLAIIVKDSTLKLVFFILMGVLFLFSILALAYFFFFSKKSHNKYLRNRRERIRKFLMINNKMSFHVRNRHWRPSPYCSYFTYMMNYYAEKGDYNSNMTVNNGKSLKNNLSTVSRRGSANSFQISNGISTLRTSNNGSKTVTDNSSFKKLSRPEKPLGNYNLREAQSPFTPRNRRNELRRRRSSLPAEKSEKKSNLIESGEAVNEFGNSKELNLMDNNVERERPKNQNIKMNLLKERLKKRETVTYKENVDYDPNSRYDLTKTKIKVPPQQSSPTIVRKMAPEFGKLNTSPYQIKRRVRYRNQQTTSYPIRRTPPAQKHQANQRIGNSNLESSNQMPWSEVPDRKIPLRNLERVVNKESIAPQFVDPNIAQDRYNNTPKQRVSKMRAYKQRGRPSRATPPKGRVRHKSPVKVGGDSMFLDKSIDGLLHHGNGGDLQFGMR